MSDAHLPKTFAEAIKMNPYALGHLWSDSALRQGGQEVEGLAVMAALAHWVQRWMPTQVHRAIAAGASLDGLVAATGMSADDLRTMWREWAAGQRHLYETAEALASGRRIGLSLEDYDRDWAVLAGRRSAEDGVE